MLVLCVAGWGRGVKVGTKLAGRKENRDCSAKNMNDNEEVFWG